MEYNDAFSNGSASVSPSKFNMQQRKKTGTGVMGGELSYTETPLVQKTYNQEMHYLSTSIDKGRGRTDTNDLLTSEHDEAVLCGKHSL